MPFGPRKVIMAFFNYDTSSVNNVIVLSLNLHPELLARSLRFHARVHAEFADTYDDAEVLRAELDLAKRLHAFADAIELGDHTIPDECDVRCHAFGSAARLQNLHPIMLNVIAEREGLGEHAFDKGS
jgi:hypothetical protein